MEEGGEKGQRDSVPQRQLAAQQTPGATSQRTGQFLSTPKGVAEYHITAFVPPASYRLFRALEGPRVHWKYRDVSATVSVFTSH